MKQSLLSLLTFAAVPGLALGQQPERSARSMTDSVYSINRVEVVSSKIRPLQEQPIQLLNLDIPIKFLPVTVSRLDRQTLERKHLVNMEEAVRFLPGVVLSSNQLGAFQRYSLRGTTDVVFAYDGIRDERVLTNTVPFGDLSDVEAIEVIKGPASILAGHSVMGGVINITRKKLSDEFHADARLGYGSWNQKDASFGVGGRLAGPVNFRAHLFWSSGDGYRRVNADRLSGTFALGTAVGKHGSFDADVRFADDRYTTDIGGAPVMPNDIYFTANDELYLPGGVRNPDCNYEDVFNDLANNYMRRRTVDVTATYTHQIARWMKLRDRFAYSRSNLDYCCVEGLTYVTSSDPLYDHWYIDKRSQQKRYIDLSHVVSGTPLCFNPDHTTYTNTLDLSGTFATGRVKHTYTAGWTYSFFDFTQYNGYNADDVWGPGVGEILSVSDPHYVRDWWESKVSAANISHYTTNGLYLTDVLDFNDHWKAMVSGRFDTYRYKRATASIDDGRQHYDPANRSDWSRVSTSAFTYRAGLVYLPVPSVSLYASATSYFKPYNTFYNKNYIYYDRNGNEFNPDDAGGEVYRPERGNQFEVGVRWGNQYIDINASLYYIRKYNVVYNIGTLTVEEGDQTVSKTVQAQVGRNVSKGFDFDITLHPVASLQIVAGMGLSDYRRIASNMDWAKDQPWVTLNEDGSINLRATGVPRTTFYTYADYTIPKGVLKGLSFHLSGTFTGRIYSSATDNIYEPSRYIVDAGVYYTIKNRVTLSVLMNNLFNNHYFASATRLAKPRNYMASIAYRF